MEPQLPTDFQPDDVVLDRYFAGESTPAERVHVEQWLAQDHGKATIARAWQAVWAGSEPKVQEAVGERIRARLDVENVGHAGAGIRGKESRKEYSGGLVRRWVGYSVAVLVVTAIGIKFIPSIINNQQPTSSTRTYVTAPGQRAVVTLSDGSQATLAPATTMRVSGRNIELTGEALFTVTQHTSNPFTVQTGNSITRVLGTTFAVRQYGSDDVTRVIVAEGKISANDVVLTTGDVATIKFGSVPEVQHGENVSMLLGWTTGRLAFNNIPLRHLLIELNRWYGLKFSADEALLVEQVTIELPTDALENAIMYLSDVLNARAIRSGAAVHFTKK